MTDRSKADETGTSVVETPALADYFAAARLDAAQPTGDFLARLEADALTMQPARRRDPATPRVLSMFRDLRDALGGWAGVAGLVSACAAGVWIGVSPPDGLSLLWTGETAGLDLIGVDPLGGFDLALVEG